MSTEANRLSRGTRLESLQWEAPAQVNKYMPVHLCRLVCRVRSAVGAGSLPERRNEDSCHNRGDTDRDPTADQPQRMGQRLLRGLHGAGSLAYFLRRYRQLDGACCGRTARLRGLHPRSHRGRPPGLRSASTALERRNRSSSEQPKIIFLTVPGTRLVPRRLIAPELRLFTPVQTLG